MGVVERRHEQAARTVVDLAEGDALVGRGRHRADIGNTAIAHPHPLVVLDGEIGVEDIDIGEEHERSFRAGRGSREEA